MFRRTVATGLAMVLVSIVGLVGAGPVSAEDECVSITGPFRIITGTSFSLQNVETERYLDEGPAVTWVPAVPIFPGLPGFPTQPSDGGTFHPIMTSAEPGNTTWWGGAQYCNGPVLINNEHHVSSMTGSSTGAVTGETESSEYSWWEIRPLDDERLQLVNAVTGEYLRATGADGGHEVETTPNPDDEATVWRLVAPID